MISSEDDSKGAHDVRWQQRLYNYRRSVDNLREALEGTSARPATRLERQGIIKAFELCYELAWKTLQDYLQYQGYDDVVGPKPVLRRAFAIGIIHNGELWSEMHRTRNEGAHIYSENLASELEKLIRTRFADPLQQLSDDLHTKAESTV